MCRSRVDEFADLLARSSAAEINAQNDAGFTALILAARNSRFDSHDKAVRLLIHAGAKLDLQTVLGRTALHSSASNSRTESQESTLQLLLQAGADINARAADGWSPLMISARFTRTTSHDSTMQLLLDAGADVDHQDIDGVSAIMYAAACVHRESQESTVQLLLQYGARVDFRERTAASTALSFYLESETSSTDNLTREPCDGLLQLVRASLRFPAVIQPYITAANAASPEGLLFHRACVVIMQQYAERLSERAAFDRAIVQLAPLSQNLTGSNSTDALVKQYL